MSRRSFEGGGGVGGAFKLRGWYRDVGALPAEDRVTLRNGTTTLVVDFGDKRGNSLHNSHFWHDGSHFGWWTTIREGGMWEEVRGRAISLMKDWSTKIYERGDLLCFADPACVYSTLPHYYHIIILKTLD